MRETRRLDILALIGGILAVTVIVLCVIYRDGLFGSQNMGQARMRIALLNCMPTPELRADLDLAAPWNPGSFIDSREALAPKLIELTRKYPNSARLWFRLGLVADEPMSSRALQRASQLDRQNALPLYILASRASSKGRWDDAMSLLTQGNARTRMDLYRFPYDGCKGNGLFESILRSGSEVGQFGSFSEMRHLAMDLAKHASARSKRGGTPEAQRLLNQVHSMGWKVIRSHPPDSINMLVGVAIIKIGQKYEREVYAAGTNGPGLQRIKDDDAKLTYLVAGILSWTRESMDKMSGRLAHLAAFGAPIGAAGAAATAATLLSMIWWGVLARRSRKGPASELHDDATARAFPIGRLLRLYALLLAVVAAVTVALVRPSSLDGALPWILQGIGAAVLALLVPAMMLWADITYKRAYCEAAASAGETISKPWRGYPAADRRERWRRLTGVFGGMMIALALWGILVSAYTKATVDAYPWQIGRAMSGMPQEEEKYLTDLVAGRVKVPDEWIRLERKMMEPHRTHRPAGKHTTK